MAGRPSSFARHVQQPGLIFKVEQIMVKQTSVILMFLLALGGALAQESGDQAATWVHIDGRKNPELVPQWSIWATAFRTIAGGPVSRGRQLIPLTLQEALSATEARLLLSEALEHGRREQACEDRVSKLAARREAAATVRGENDAIVMECRWQTIHARDRVLRALSPPSQTALSHWVESLKAGKQISVPKKDLAKFLLPQ
jgi:hypothetical protein